MNSADAARAADVPPSTLRYYERRGFLSPARDPHSGYRQYTEADVRRVRFVQRAQELGFGMGDVAAFLALARDGAVPAARLRTVVDAKLDDLDERIADLTRMRRALAALADEGEGGEGGVDAGCACPVEAALVGGGAECD